MKTLSFLATGEIDSRNSNETLQEINAILAESITYVENVLFPGFSFWPLMNWVMVVYFWTYLYTLGQIQPTSYNLVETPAIFP